MENRNLWQVTQLHKVLRFCFLSAAIALVLIFRVELGLPEMLLQTFLECRLEPNRKTAVWLVRDTLILTAGTFDNRPLNAREYLINTAGVCVEILSIDLRYRPFVFSRHITIKLGAFNGRLLVLQLRHDVHQELMRVMLHQWEELLPD